MLSKHIDKDLLAWILDETATASEKKKEKNVYFYFYQAMPAARIWLNTSVP